MIEAAMAWWEYPLEQFYAHLESPNGSGKPRGSPGTIRWVRWALKDFCNVGFPDSPPLSREQVRDMVRDELSGAGATKKSYYAAVSWWLLWVKNNVSGFEELPELGRESFGRRSRYRKRNGHQP